MYGCKTRYRNSSGEQEHVATRKAAKKKKFKRHFGWLEIVYSHDLVNCLRF